MSKALSSRQTLLRSALALALPLALLGTPAIANDHEMPEGLSVQDIESYAQQTIEAFNITGLSIAVVSSDDVIFQKSYGQRDIRTDVPVDEDTIFPFGSVGKAFTTAALATLVDEGKLDWDDPVRKYIPEFEMSDPYITREFTVRDLLTHRSGLPLGAGDLMIFPDGYASVQDILNVFKHIEPATSFRSEYAYDNLMYIVAGDVLARIHGGSYAEALEARLFEPLGLESCDARPSRAAKAANGVTQHSRDVGTKNATPLDPRYIIPDSSAPAGGISCSISDMAKWAQFWLRGGTSETGDVVLSEARVSELWTGVTPTGVPRDIKAFANAHFNLYALGWSVADFHGEWLVSHGGGLLGAVSYFALLPDQDVGIVFMTNDFLPFVSGLGKQILQDVTAPEADFDWIANAEGWYNSYLETALKDAGAASEEPADVPVDPVRPLEDYVGSYRDPWYGLVTIRQTDEGLFVDMSRSEIFDTTLVSLGDDRFVARWPDRSLNADAYLDFVTEDDVVTGLRMNAVSETTDFSFDFHDLRLEKVTP